MLNKNVADYTNFDGKTNKKIVQAPGGASSFSLAWSNQKTDYGPQKHYRKQSRQKNPEYQPRQQQRVDYNEPIRVMDQAPYSYGSKKNVGMMPPQSDGRMGGEYGYNNYGGNRASNDQQGMGGYGQPQGYGNYGNYRVNQPVQQLDIAIQAIQQQRVSKNQRPPSNPRQENPNMQGKSSIKINGPPKENNIFGGNQYNYWKEDSRDQKKQSTSEKRINQQYEQYGQYGQGQGQGQGQNYYQNANKQKTSVKVHNPPGGKQSFTLG